MDIHISFSDIRASPVYIPAFVMRSTHFGRKLRTFVSGTLPVSPPKFQDLIQLLWYRILTCTATCQNAALQALNESIRARCYKTPRISCSRRMSSWCGSAGISSSTVTGSRALDETRVGLVAGVLGGIALIASGLSATLTPLQVWTFGVASPAVVAGFAARYYTHLLGAVREYWSRQEQRRCCAKAYTLQMQQAHIH